MSKFTSDLVNGIAPYVPGEQPRGKTFIKLNTNENPYFTNKNAIKIIDKGVLEKLNRYSDPECSSLTKAIADYYGVDKDNVLVTNGSDEALAFAFFAYGKSGVCYPDVTYGFYDVIANLYCCPIEHIDLNNDFTVDETMYFNSGKTVVIANPNAQTGIELPKEKLENITKNNQSNVVIVDQAYADFGENNAIDLIKKYPNLLVINTFSKSRSLAGARVGYAIGDKALIEDIKKVKNSFHPYNVNSISAALAEQAILDDEYFKATVQKVKKSRNVLSEELKQLGFICLSSSANFVLAKHGKISGDQLYLKLKDNGVLVRHFNDKRISDFVRITVGTEDEIAELLRITKTIINDEI